MTRSQFLKNSLMTMGGLSAAGSSTAVYLERGCHFDQLDVTRYAIAHNQLPAGYNCRIMFATDFHVGSVGVSLDKAHSIVDQMNAEQADLILMGGDYQNNTLWNRNLTRPYPTTMKIAHAFSGLKAPGGVCGVMGNHDWDRSGDAMIRAMDAVGIPIGENRIQPVTVNGLDLNIACMPDYKTRWGRFDRGFCADLYERARDRPYIILSHDPITYKDAPHHAEALVQLSGHTHGGQIRVGSWTPFRPTDGTPDEWIYGHVPSHDDGPDLIVSSGIGTSRVPFRNARKELVVVTLQGPAP